jgi:hypothetical protein
MVQGLAQNTGGLLSQKANFQLTQTVPDTAAWSLFLSIERRFLAFYLLLIFKMHHQ